MNFINKDKYYHSKGIYIIKNLINNKVYVGSTFNTFSNRYITHKSRLKRNVHHSPHLQNAWNKYGKDNFEFIPLEILEDNTIISKREEILIKKYNSILDGYNVTALVEGKRIKKHSIKTRAKMNKDKNKKICQYDLKGNFIKIYPSIQSTKKDGFNPKVLSECLRGRYRSHGNYLWEYYTNNYKLKINPLKPRKNWSIKIIDLSTNKIYKGVPSVSKELGLTTAQIDYDLYGKNKRFKKV